MAAKILATQGAALPESYQQLLQLPGIGPYTASAIMAIAFNKPYTVLDANVERLFARLLDLSKPVKEKETIALIRNQLEDLLPTDQPRAFNQALMEFGALVCKPGIPNCAWSRWRKLPRSTIPTCSTGSPCTVFSVIYCRIKVSRFCMPPRRRAGCHVRSPLFDTHLHFVNREKPPLASLSFFISVRHKCRVPSTSTMSMLLIFFNGGSPGVRRWLGLLKNLTCAADYLRINSHSQLIACPFKGTSNSHRPTAKQCRPPSSPGPGNG